MSLETPHNFNNIKHPNLINLNQDDGSGKDMK